MSSFEEELRKHTETDQREFEFQRGEHKEIRHLVADVAQSVKMLADTTTRIEESIKPLTGAYNGILFSKKVLTGLAAIILALAAIGGGVIWIVNAAVHNKVP